VRRDGAGYTSDDVGAQSAARWQLEWKTDAVRYVDNVAVPIGSETFTLTVTRVGAADSVLAILPTANPAITDTLDGVMSSARLTLRSRPRGATARPMSGGPPASGVSVTTMLELAIQGDSASGKLTRLISGIPGAAVPPAMYQVTATRLP
jgi:hypothetical protein